MKAKKSKEQIIDAHENRFVLTVMAGGIQIIGMALTIVLSDDSNYSASNIAALISFTIGLILIGFAVKCPICDQLKSPEYFDAGIFQMKTGFFRCGKCKLSNKQIREYVDLLKRSVEIDKNIIAGFNKRDL